MSKRAFRVTGIACAIIFVIASFLTPIFAGDKVSAAVWDGRCFTGAKAPTCGYFYGRYNYTMHGSGGFPTQTSHSYVLRNGVGGYTADELLNSINSYRNNGANDLFGKWDRSGAAFIVHTVLGRTGDQANANGGKSISAADWSSFEQRIRTASINFNAWVCAGGVNTLTGVNPAHNADSIDVSRSNDAAVMYQCDWGITITDSFGNQYNLIRKCGNPAGRMDEIKVSSDYNLTPTITSFADQAAIETPQASLNVAGAVTNAGPTNSRDNTNWQLTQLVYAQSYTLPASYRAVSTSASGTNPCARFSGALACDAIGSGARTYGVGVNTPDSATATITERPVGTQICFVLSVRPYAHNTDDWRHSAMLCYRVGVKPKVDIIGGDLYVGRKPNGFTGTVSGRVVTSQTTNTTGRYGSWGEYSVVASGPVTSMASGSAYVGGNPLTPNLLTFVNTGTAGVSCGSLPGCYTATTTLPDIASRFPTTAATPSFGGGSLSALNGTYRASGAITITASTIPSGHSVIINAPTGNVTLTGNITYAIGGALSSYSDIPQVVIIAQNITITAGVTQVDSWLIAPGTVATGGGSISGGVIRTCDVAAASLNAGVCNQKLTVNGPVVANRLLLLRTGGAGTGTAAGDPAEVFNFRPDAYLWALQRGESAGRVTTVTTKELPPRY